MRLYHIKLFLLNKDKIRVRGEVFMSSYLGNAYGQGNQPMACGADVCAGNACGGNACVGDGCAGKLCGGNACGG